MSALLWPLVALVGLVLAYRVAVLALARRQRLEERVDALAESVHRSGLKLSADFAAKLAERDKEFSSLKQRVIEVDQRTNPDLQRLTRR